MRLGFACTWDASPEATWSYTPWNLRAALYQQVDVHDLGVHVHPTVRLGLRVAHTRRVDGRWTSMWKHSAAGRRLVESTLRSRARHDPCDVVLQIQDLARFDVPYLVLQDLSYDVLLTDETGVLSQFPGLNRSQLLRLRDRQHGLYRDAAGVLAMSQWFADHLVRHSGVPRERVHVVNPGASAQIDTVDDLAAARRIASPRRRMLFVGRDFERKGGTQVLGALRLLRSDVDPAITLTVVGPATWPLPTPPPAGVRFLGRLPLDQLPAVYSEHDLFLMPSRFEGFGIALAEALAHGLPCVARDAFAMPEIVRPGENGELVRTTEASELADVIATVLADEQVWRTVAAQAGATRSHYSWTRAARDVVAVAKTVS